MPTPTHERHVWPVALFGAVAALAAPSLVLSQPSASATTAVYAQPASLRDYEPVGPIGSPRVSGGAVPAKAMQPVAVTATPAAKPDPEPASAEAAAVPSDLSPSTATPPPTPTKERTSRPLRLEQRELALTLKRYQAEADELRAMIVAEYNRYAGDLQAIEAEAELAQLAASSVSRAQALLDQEHLISQSQLDQTIENKLKRDLVLAARVQSVAEHPARLAQLEARLAQAESRRDLARLALDTGRSALAVAND